MEMNSSSLKKTARIAGILFLFWVLTGVYGIFYVPSVQSGKRASG